MTDPRHAIGGNNPPEPTPFDLATEAVDTVYTEAQNWLDGAPIETQAQADEVSKLLRLATEAEKEADAYRKAEAKPFDEGKAEVQARYKPLLARATAIKDGCKKLLAPFLAKLEAARQEELRKAREAEDAARRAAEEAARKAAVSTDIAAQEAAERAAQEAREASAEARQIATNKSGADGMGRKVTLRSVWHASITDPNAVAAHYWTTDRAALTELLDQLVQRDKRAGIRSIPGVQFTEEKVAQ